MMLKVGFLVGASVIAFAVSQISSNSRNMNRKSLTDVFAENSCDSRFQEGNFEEAENEKKATVQAENHKDHEAFELEFLKNVVEEMEQRGMSQEKKLLELYSLKQQQLCFMDLQKQLKDKIIKIDKLNAVKNALTDDRTKLHENINKNLNAKTELEIAKERIKEIQTLNIKDDGETRERLMILNEHLLGLNKKGIPILDSNIEKKLLAMKDVELEAAAMKRKNRDLRLKARELAVELETTEARVAALSKMTEEKVMSNVEEEISNLKNSNGDLLEKVERLQKNKFDMVEGLVYQRWLNVCLRSEIQDYNTPREMKPKHDLKKKLSFDSHIRAKRVSLESISSMTSSMDSDEASEQKNISTKFSLIRSIKRWGKVGRSSRSKEKYLSGNVEYSVSQGVIRRFSMSDVPSNPSILRNRVKQELTESPEMSNPRRARRVSFSDSLKPDILIFSDALKLGASEDVTKTSLVERNSDASSLGASGNVTETNLVELECHKSEISSSIVNVVEANYSKMLRQEDMEDDKRGSERANNGDSGQRKSQYQGMADEELDKPKGNIQDQSLHIPVMFIFLLSLILFISVLLFRL